MNKFINFVENYKDIFSTNTSHITINSKKKIVFDIFKLVVIIISLATIIGYITNATKNLSYVVYILHTVFLGSFIFYLYIYNVKNFEKEEELKTYIVVILSALPLISIILLSNGIFFAYFLDAISITFNVYLFIIVGAIAFMIVVVLSYMEVVYRKRMGFYIILYTFTAIVLYISIFKFLPFENIRLSYLISTTILYGLFFLKKVLSYYLKGMENVLSLQIIILIFSLFTYFRFDILDEIFVSESFLTSVFNISSSYTFDDLDGLNLKVNGDYLLITGFKEDSEDVFQIYDLDFNLVKEIPKGDDSYITYMNGKYYLIKSESNDTRSYLDYTVSTLDNNYEVIKEESMIKLKYGEFFPIGENEYAFQRVNDETNETYLEVYNTVDHTRYELHHSDFDNKEIIYRDDNRVVFVNRGAIFVFSSSHPAYNYPEQIYTDNISLVYFSNSYVLVRDDNSSTIVSFDDYLANDYQDAVEIEVSGYSFTKGVNNYYITYQDDSYNTFYSVYNLNGKQINSVNFTYEGYTNYDIFTKVTYINNQLVLKDGNILNFIDPENLNIIRVNQDLSKDERVAASMLIIYASTLLSSSVLLVRGEKDE